MAPILDIAGKPLPPRNRAKRALRSQDIRDILKIFVVLAIVISGFFIFAPARDAAAEMRVATAEKAQG